MFVAAPASARATPMAPERDCWPGRPQGGLGKIPEALNRDEGTRRKPGRWENWSRHKQTEAWTKIGPVTFNMDETKWDRILPISRAFLAIATY